MPIAAPDDWQRSFQALLPNVKISFANMAQNQQAQQAWDNTQDSNANQKPERRLSQPTLPQTQSQAQPNQLSQSQPQIQQQQQTKKGAKQTQMPNQQMQQQQIQIQQHQMQQLHHHQQQQQLQQLQQQLHQQQLLQHQQLQQQLQQQQMHLQQHQLQQLQQRQQQIHQLQLQQQYQQLQADNKSPLPTSPRAGDENSEWFNNHVCQLTLLSKYIFLLLYTEKRKPRQIQERRVGCFGWVSRIYAQGQDKFTTTRLSCFLSTPTSLTSLSPTTFPPPSPWQYPLP